MPNIDKIFTCPDCGGHKIEEVLDCVVASSLVLWVGEDGDADYGQSTNERGEVDAYQCFECGWLLDGVRNTEELYDFLQNIRENER